jgi:hypothetical protein
MEHIDLVGLAGLIVGLIALLVARVQEVLREWQKDKNAAVLRKIFGESPLFEPDKNMMS